MSKLNKLEMLDTLFEKLANMPAQMAQAQARPPGSKPYVTLSCVYQVSIQVGDMLHVTD